MTPRPDGCSSSRAACRPRDWPRSSPWTPAISASASAASWSRPRPATPPPARSRCGPPTPRAWRRSQAWRRRCGSTACRSPAPSTSRPTAPRWRSTSWRSPLVAGSSPDSCRLLRWATGAASRRAWMPRSSRLRSCYSRCSTSAWRPPLSRRRQSRAAPAHGRTSPSTAPRSTLSKAISASRPSV